MFEKTRAILKEEKARKKARDKRLAPKKLEQILVTELKETLENELTTKGHIACTLEVKESELGVFQDILTGEINDLYDYKQTTQTTFMFSAKKLGL